MNPERWQRIEEIFQATRERATAGERAAFLDGACGTDTELRAEVEQLLNAEDSAGSFINTSAVKVAASMVAGDRVAQMAGKTISHYKIVSALGAGGMGEVYLATDTRHGRQVALKLLPDHLLKDPERVRRFQQEARAVLALNHPNIVTVYEIGNEANIQFMASELVKGQTLRDRMAGAPLKLNEAIDIASQVAAALAEAHQHGVVHRDIKPENIMLRPDGYVKVLDFGIAKLTEAPQSMETDVATLLKVQTRPGMVLGSAHYMSPEQARGLQVDERTDIWSLGIVLYEMVTGRVPFDGETPSDCIAAILNNEPPALTRWAINVPEALEVIVSSALTKDRDERYHAVKELLGALRRLKQRLDASAEIERSLAPQATGSGVSGTSAEAAARLSREVSQTLPTTHSTSSAEYIVGEIKRHKISVIAGLGVLVVAVIGISFAIYKLATRQSTPPNYTPKFTALTSGGKIGDQAVEGDLSLSSDGRYIAYVARDQKNHPSLNVMQIATRTQSQIIPPSDGDYMYTVFSPDNEFVYFGQRETGMAEPVLYRVPVLGGTPTKVLENVTGAITFSPDGKQFAFVRDEQLKRVNTSVVVANTDGSGEPRIIAQRKAPEYFNFIGPSWSPDGKMIAVAAGSASGADDQSVVGIPVAGGSEISLTPDRWTLVAHILWLSDTSGFVMTAKKEHGNAGTQIWFVSYPGGTARRITNDVNGYGQVSLGISADGSTMATVQSRTDVQIWTTPPNEDESKAKRITTGDFDGVTGLSFSADNRIVYVGASGQQIDIWTVNADGSQRKQITSDSYVEENPVISPDGRYIVFASNRSGAQNLWRTDVDGSNAKQLTNGETMNDYPAFSPDSQWIVFNSNRGGGRALSLWKVSVNGGQPVELSSKFAAFPHVSPDGKFVACALPDENSGARLRLLILSIDGGEPVKTIDLPPTATPFNGKPFWTPDGQAVTFINLTNNLGNVWTQPIDGSPPKQLTNFKSLWIYDSALSRDGRQIALARGDVYSDIVLIKDFR